MSDRLDDRVHYLASPRCGDEKRCRRLLRLSGRETEMKPPLGEQA